MEPHQGGRLVPEPLSMVGSNRIKGHLMEGKGVHGKFLITHVEYGIRLDF